MWLIIVVAGIAAGYGIRVIVALLVKNTLEHKGQKALDEARAKADGIVKEAEVKSKDVIFKKREEVENEAKEKREELREIERRLNKKEDNLDAKTELLDRKAADIRTKEQRIDGKEDELNKKILSIDETIEAQKTELHRISNLSLEEARRILLDKIEKEVEGEAADIIKNRIEKARATAEKEAQKIIAIAMEKCASEFVANNVISSVPLPSDEMKGRVIGREGRNIRAFEKAAGVDLIVDDTPELVVVSCFNGVRRETARIAMERLIADGRIHPGRIEEVVNKVRKEVANDIRETGERTMEEVGIPKVHPKIVEFIGALKFRTSYGQNVLQHSVEVAFLAGSIAAELGLDEMTARRAGLLHDIGKAVDQEKDGTHLEIGGKIARRFNEKDIIVNAIEAHHEGAVEATSIYTVIIKAADAVSAARPGARRDTLERYIQRMAKIEEVAYTFPGVTQAFALQAGREVRVMVNANEINDKAGQMLCRDIAKKIEAELTYPGEIKVTLIREMRAIEYAR
ncbi:MAG: ribonuclease Y [Planctomycetota bacterium]